MSINERNYTGFALSPVTGRPHRIRHLPKMVDWEPAVYMYEAGDKFVADIDGIDNLPGQQLANRTEYLYEQNKLLGEACRGLVSIVRDISVGKTAINGYKTVLSRKRPAKFCAWVEPQNDWRGEAEMCPYIDTEAGELFCNPVAQIESEQGFIFYVGGSGEDFPHIVKIIGTVELIISATDLMQGGAWIQPQEGAGQMLNPSAEVVLEDGTVLDNPTGMIVNENDEAYFVRTYPRDKDPLYEEVVEVNGFEVATHGDIDALVSR